MIITILAALAAQAAASAAEIPSTESSARNGAIILYRGSSLMGAAVACPIRYKGRELVELGRGKYAEWAVPAGRYTLTNKTASVEVMVDPGETRFVRCRIKPGFLAGNSDLQIVDAESFNENRAEYERKEIIDPLG